ncbi:MAG: Holliday junction branch migration protein RuvA [Lachnospiraceae bacterium]|nr:Holliday junction branch migration protein RuvA [Lachnospiraceae bacterium]
MYAYVKGIVADIEADNCVIDVNDIGYNVQISGQTAAKLPGIGEKVKLFTYTNVKEDTLQLFGFLTKADLEMFKKCITVNGIGPKGAQALLSVMDADELRFAIISQDVKAISKAPGIGKRTAERLVLELKDKLSIDDAMINREIASYQGTISAVDNAQKQEAVEALVSLGYGQTESLKAVNAVEGAENMDAGALLKAALKKMF